MTKNYLDELVTNGVETWQKKSFKGTHAERLAFNDPEELANLHENDTWLETDTFRLYFWNNGEWITKE